MCYQQPKLYTFACSVMVTHAFSAAGLHALDTEPDIQDLLTAGMKMSLRGQMLINCTSGPQKAKTGNLSAHRRANTHSLQQKSQRSEGIISNFWQHHFPFISEGGLGPHIFHAAARWATDSFAWRARNSSEVRGQTTENETPSKSRLPPEGWELNT